MTGEASVAESASILVVDDQPGNLLSLQAVLERSDYDLVLAHDGPEALAHVLRKEFAVILLDVAMPGMDGFEVASIIKQRHAYRTIPIIFVTASVQHIGWIFKAYSVGAVDFLMKPLDPDQVRAKVAVFVDLYRQRQQLQRQAEQLREQEQIARTLELERLRFQHERRFRNLFEAIPHIVWVAKGDGEIEYVNRRWSEVTGAAEHDAKGRRWVEFVHPDDAERVRACWVESTTAGEPFQLEFRLRTRSGSFSWHHGRALPERDNGSGVVRWVGTFTDVDEGRRSQEELRLAVRMRDEFLAVASHELRTPLTSLKLRVESVLRTGPAEMSAEKLAGGLQQALKQVDRLGTLINRLLDVSRLTTGRLEVKPEPCDLAAIAREVAHGMDEEAGHAGSSLVLHAAEPVEGTWDRLRLAQVIANLLSNAIKYGAGKPVDLAVSGDETSARIAVTDRGIGIAQNEVQRIFGAFERAVPLQNYGGLGLGLYVVAQIVFAHGGRVDVRTRPGEGATFVVTLPRRRAAARGDEAGTGEEAGKITPTCGGAKATSSQFATRRRPVRRGNALAAACESGCCARQA